jgi:Tol biopolymer transport system component
MSSLTPPLRPAALAAAQLKRVLAVVAAVCVGGLAAGVGPATAAFPGQNGKIVFASAFGGFDEGTSDIYTMSPNGRHLLNLTPDSPANDDFPRWSADGRMIAFWSTRTGPDNPTGDQEIFVMNANGSGLRQVTKNKVDDGAPAWSPNGDRLVFHRWLADPSQADPDDRQADLITVRVNGTGERNLTRSPGILDLQAVWSPNGREIVFARDDSGLENDIYTIRPDGSHLRALTATPTDEESPDWSPDGKRIAFQADAAMPGEQWDVYVIRGDGGSPPIRLTTAGGYHAAWSPNGRKIVFSSYDLADHIRLFTMRADGSRPKQRTVRPEFQDNHPDWQPAPKDGRAEDDDD